MKHLFVRRQELRRSSLIKVMWWRAQSTDSKNPCGFSYRDQDAEGCIGAVGKSAGDRTGIILRLCRPFDPTQVGPPQTLLRYRELSPELLGIAGGGLGRHQGLRRDIGGCMDIVPGVTGPLILDCQGLQPRRRRKKYCQGIAGGDMSRILAFARDSTGIIRAFSRG